MDKNLLKVMNDKTKAMVISVALVSLLLGLNRCLPVGKSSVAVVNRNLLPLNIFTKIVKYRHEMVSNSNLGQSLSTFLV